MKCFDYESVACEAKIPEEKLRKLVNLSGKSFPMTQLGPVVLGPVVGSDPANCLIYQLKVA